MEIMVLHLDILSVGADIYMQSVPYPLAGVAKCAAKGHQLTKSMCRLVADSFYRAMPGMRGTSRGPVSVCLCVSVTSRCSTKTDECGNIQTTPLDSQGV